jgi:hypothetical protein
MAVTQRATLFSFLVFTSLVLVVKCQVYPESFFNGFENPGVDVDAGNRMASVTVQLSGTNGITAASGNYYAVATPTNFGSPSGAVFTRYGGYGGTTFPTDGYTTSLDVYLDTDESTDREGNDEYKRFDWSSAINNAQNDHRRDFIIHCGTDLNGNFIFSASNNAPGDPRNGDSKLRLADKNLGTGWYTLEHTFRNENGLLAVDMRVIYKATGEVLSTWTRRDPTDVIDVTVGGNRYGWLVVNDFDSLELDNVTRSGELKVPKTANDCKKGGWENLYRSDNTSFKNQGDCIQYVNTGM